MAEAAGSDRSAAPFWIGYGEFRFIAEFFRDPDAFLGVLSLGLSMGQWLSFPMIAAGALLWAWATWWPVTGVVQ